MSYRHGARGGDASVGGGRVADDGTPGKQTLVHEKYGVVPARSASSTSGLGGDQADEAEGRALGGDETGPAKSDGGGSGVTGGDATSVSTADLAAAEWKDHGQFKWWIKWVTDGTKGWIVQRIVNTYAGTDSAGGKITNASVGTTPSYYEAWEVDSKGVITGSLGGTGNRDRWERPSQGTGSKGNWSMTGTVYWTKDDPAKSGFTSGGVGNAGSLLSSTKAPAGLSGALATRSANGTWDSTGAKPTHTGSAS
jgi:hypothetical protein